VVALLAVDAKAAGDYSSSYSARDGGGGGLARPLNGGIVYPSLYGAIEQNPSGLIHDNKTVLMLQWAPAMGSVTSSTVTEGLAYGNRAFGLGASASAALDSGGVMRLSKAAVALGIGAPGFGFGVNTVYDSSAGGLDMDVGIGVENSSGIQISLLVTSVQAFRSTGAMNLGIGISKPQKYQIEGSWGFTILSPLAQNVLRLVGVGYLGIVGLGVEASSTSSTTTSSWAAGGSVLVQVTGRVGIGTRVLFDSVTRLGLTASAQLAF